MRVVVDTNVFVSGVFFSGPPHEILEAWRDRRLTLVVSPEILAEHQATGDELASQFPDVDLTPWLELVATLGVIVQAPSLSEQVCADPDDDKFLACALAGRCRLVISGDRALLRTDGYRGIRVLRPRKFVDDILSKR